MPEETDHFIDGIYNYCDRWCERCPFTTHCRLYADLEARGGHDVDSIESTLEFVRAVFAETRQLLDAAAEKFGFKLLDDDEIASEMQHLEENRRRAEKHPLVELSHRYVDVMNAWSQTERDLLRYKAESLVAQVERGEDLEGAEATARRLLEAFEIVRYHHWQIGVKLHRALSSRERSEMNSDDASDPVQSDSNGSAKVALIAIDRSLAAWRVLKGWVETSTVDPMVETLEALRASTEREFPRARAFVRPGFDTAAV